MKDVCRVAIPKSRYDKLMQNHKARLKCEDRCGVVLAFEKDNAITIEGESDRVFFAKDVLIAYGRGFSMGTSLKLLNEGYSMLILDLRDFTGKKNDLLRIKGRLIGTEGKAKLTMESLSGCRISLKGRKVAAIGNLEDVENLKKALIDLIEGKKHSTVYAYLEKMNRKRKAGALMWQTPLGEKTEQHEDTG